MGNLIVTEPTPRLIRIWENYGGKKSGSTTNVKAFDNFDHNSETGTFYANTVITPNEYSVNVKRVSEQEFIDTLGLWDLPEAQEPRSEGFRVGDIIVVTNVNIERHVWKEGLIVVVEGNPNRVAVSFEEGIDAPVYILNPSDIILKSEFKDNPTNEKGGKKESEGKLNYELDFDFIREMAVRMDKNDKYPPYNWQKPVDVETLKKGLCRHVMDVMRGVYEDDGEDLGHFHAIATNAMMIHYQLKHFKDEN